MAKVFGQLPINYAEEKVVLALKEQLPPDWVVVPGVRWARRDANGNVGDGEADAVVLAPRIGMLIVEVKGSREIRVVEEGWQRLENGRWLTLDRSPIEQATSNAYELKRLLCDELRWGKSFPGLFGWLAIYPNGNANAVPPLFDSTTLATRQNMTGLRGKIQDALASRGSPTIGESFTPAALEAAARVLTSSEFRIVPADGAEEVSDDKEAIEKLTRQQFAILRGLFELPSVAVTGPAGSGKTILAIWRLESALASGSRAIYVCYNTRLAEAMRLRHPDLAQHIHSADQLFGKTCPGKTPQGSREEFHSKELPNHVFDEVTAWDESRKYDVVLVDEAQDLSVAQIIALTTFKKEKGAWAVFLDLRQNVYRRQAEEALDADVLFRLSHNCRNTVKINAATNSFMKSDIDSMPGMPDGVPVTFERVSKPQMANRAFQIAAEWKQDNKNTVAILSPRKLENSAMAGHPTGHGLALSEGLKHLPAAGKVYFSTIKSFKGIEADCVIVVDAVEPMEGNQYFSLEDLYVACTRAKTRLVILSADQEAITYFQNAGGAGGSTLVSK